MLFVSNSLIFVPSKFTTFSLFNNCMLQNGAQKVYAIDVGHSQLAERIK